MIARLKVMAARDMAKSEAQWQAEMDARTLMDAAKVRADSKRHAAAKVALRKLISEAEASLAAGKAAAE